jgi:acyl-CoA synthetase (AMP-forming)/AMP-acid ligase II
VATIDKDGFMQITDRSKDVIKSGGEWISSIDIENIAMAHPDVAMANALREVATADYTFDGGAIDIVRLYQQFAAGATIIMNQLHRYVPTLGALVRSIELELSARMQTNIYLSPREAQGLKIHYDSHDVFVLQVHGVKLWNLYETQVPLPFRGQHFGDEGGRLMLRLADMEQDRLRIVARLDPLQQVGEALERVVVETVEARIQHGKTADLEETVPAHGARPPVKRR